MAHYSLLITHYFQEWWTIIVRPIYFYTRLKEENWQEKSLDFLLATSWLLALPATLVIFILQYLPIGSTLIEGISGYKLILIAPVMLTLAAVFFLITIFIVGGIFVIGLFTMLYVVAWVLHYLFTWGGGKGSLNRMIQSLFYSSAVFLFGAILFLLMLLTKYSGLSFSLFQVGFNFIYFLLLLYIYGLWAIAGRKTYHLARWQAFAWTLVPIIGLLIFGLLFDKIALSKLQSWIT